MICIEDLNLKGLARTKLAKSFMDAGHGEFIRQLRYKSDWKGKHLVQVNQWFPSSKLCSNCSHKNDELKLEDRQWICLNCGASHNRDKNAAINMLNEGIRIFVATGSVETINGRGADVRLPLKKAVCYEASRASVSN
jgi:putative transposase